MHRCMIQSIDSRMAKGLVGVNTHHWDDFLLDERRERNELEEESKVELFSLKATSG